MSRKVTFELGHQLSRTLLDLIFTCAKLPLNPSIIRPWTPFNQTKHTIHSSGMLSFAVSLLSTIAVATFVPPSLQYLPPPHSTPSHHLPSLSSSQKPPICPPLRRTRLELRLLRSSKRHSARLHHAVQQRCELSHVRNTCGGCGANLVLELQLYDSN